MGCWDAKYNWNANALAHHVIPDFGQSTELRWHAVANLDQHIVTVKRMVVDCCWSTFGQMSNNQANPLQTTELITVNWKNMNIMTFEVSYTYTELFNFSVDLTVVFRMFPFISIDTRI